MFGTFSDIVFQIISKLFSPAWIYVSKCQTVRLVEVFLLLLGVFLFLRFFWLLFVFGELHSLLLLNFRTRIFAYTFDFIFLDFFGRFLMIFVSFLRVFVNLVIKENLCLYKLASIDILVEVVQILIDEISHFIKFFFLLKLDSQ